MEAKLLVIHASIGLTRGSVVPRPPLCCSISQAVMMGCGGEIGGRGFDGVKDSASPAGYSQQLLFLLDSETVGCRFAFALKRIDRSDSLTLGLDRIRHSLILQEDSIIFGLLEGAQYCYKPETYNPDAFAMEGFNGFLVEFMLKETEKLQAQVGRYKSPDEHPFFPDDLPDPKLPPLQYP